MQRRLITSLTLAAGACVVLALAAAPANASPGTVDATPIVASSTVTVVPAHVTGTPAMGVTEVVTSAVIPDAGATAASGCKHNVQIDELDQAPLNWPELAWFKMDTYFCWNGKIVTYHTTTQHGEPTGPGGNAGWSYAGTIDGTVGWSCYVAVGSKTNCSGNEEHAQGSFPECLIKYGCISQWEPYIQSWENYHGGMGRWN